MQAARALLADACLAAAAGQRWCMQADAGGPFTPPPCPCPLRLQEEAAALKKAKEALAGKKK